MAKSVQVDISRVVAQFNGMPALLDKAIKSSFINTFRDVEADVRKTFFPKIDRPIPFTVGPKAFYSTTKNYGNQKIGIFGIQGKQASYLQFMLKGTARDQKIIERKTATDRKYIPSRQIKLDQYGNIPRAEYLRIMKVAFSASPQKEFVRIPIGNSQKLVPGIYRREGEKLIPWMFNSTRPITYKSVYDFFGEAERLIIEKWPDAVTEAIQFRLKKGS